MTQAATGAAGDRAGTALLRAALHVLLAAWRLSLPEAATVLGVPVRTLLGWRERPDSARVDPLLRQRLAALLRLHKALRARWPAASDQRAWLRAPRPGGDTPIDRLRAGGSASAAALCRELDTAPAAPPPGEDPG